MIDEMKTLKNEVLNDRPREEKPKNEFNGGNEANMKVKEIIQCAYLMQKTAFEQEIDSKFPFFFTQLNKIQMTAEKLKRMLADHCADNDVNRGEFEGRLREKNGKLKTESARLEKENKTLLKELNEAKREIDKVSEKYSSTLKELKKQERIIKNLKEENADVKEENKYLQNENQNLKKEIREFKKIEETRNAKLIEEYTTVIKERDQGIQENKRLRLENKTLIQQCDSLRSEYKYTKEEYEKSRRQISTLKDENERIKEHHIRIQHNSENIIDKAKSISEENAILRQYIKEIKQNGVQSRPDVFRSYIETLDKDIMKLERNLSFTIDKHFPSKYND